MLPMTDYQFGFRPAFASPAAPSPPVTHALQSMVASTFRVGFVSRPGSDHARKRLLGLEKSHGNVLCARSASAPYFLKCDRTPALAPATSCLATRYSSGCSMSFRLLAARRRRIAGDKIIIHPPAKSIDLFGILLHDIADSNNDFPHLSLAV